MIGYIDENGVYRREKDRPMLHDISSQWKDWSHMEQRKRFSKDIIQPWVHGKPNREFIDSYPEESKTYFKPEQIARAERDLGGVYEQQD